ncbi:MAG: hypothetical protein WAV72_14395, partial [Bradyrhizobium sp.]
MDETLKALQLAERALLALIGALLVFVISADRTTGPYEAALSELNVLQRTLPLIRQANIDEGRVAYASSNLAKIVADVAKKVTVDAQKVDYHVALSKNQMDSIPPMYYANSPQKIDDYYNYIKSAKFGGIRMFEFDEVEARRELEKLFPLAGTKLTDIYIGPMQDEKYKEIPNQCQIGIAINTKSKNNEVKETGPIKCQPPSWLSYKKSLEI